MAGTVFRVKTTDGTIVLQVNEPDADVFVDGEKITVTRLGGEPIEIRKTAGQYALEVKKVGFAVGGQSVTLTAGGREQVTVRLVPADGQQVPMLADAAQVADQAGVTYLSTIKTVRSKANRGWFAWNGTMNDGKIIEVRGKASPHGIFLHAQTRSYSELVYNLDPKWTVFRCGVAVPLKGDERKGLGSALVFEVIGDRRVLWRSNPVVNFDDPQWCDVKIEGVNELCIRVNCPGDSSYARAVWLEPRLFHN